MRTKNDKNKLSKLPTVEELLSMKYGVVGTPEREDFDAKSKAWYYASVLKTARKTAGITQKQLADRIGKKREYNRTGICGVCEKPLEMVFACNSGVWNERSYINDGTKSIF